MLYVAYILESESTGKYYIGHTNNIERRLSQHNSEKAGFTKRYQPWKIIYSEKFETEKEAIRLEGYLKSLKNKERINQYTAGWRSSIS